MADEVFHLAQDAVTEFTRQLNESIAKAIKSLLEEKHLYQKLSIEPDALAGRMVARVYKERRSDTEKQIGSVMNQRFILTRGAPLLAAPRGQEPQVIPALMLRNVRLFCQTCNERQTFKPVWYQDATNELLKLSAHGELELNFNMAVVQLFFIAYQCEHCHGAPEGFLIRRDGWRFSLDGRAPMEHIQLPVHIPKKEGNLFRDALVARFAGKQLAAVFYLRTFIEQFARRQTGMKGRETGDEIMEAYSGSLPNAQRDQMPSLREWYGKLSAPIHTADEVAADNKERQPWALCVPYKMGDAWKGCYPDFLIFRRKHGIIVDIVDPHLISLEDAPLKAAALANFAEDHQDRFGRIDLVIVDNAGKQEQRTKRLRLMDEKTRKRVMGVTTNRHLKDLFEVGG